MGKERKGMRKGIGSGCGEGREDLFVEGRMRLCRAE